MTRFLRALAVSACVWLAACGEPSPSGATAAPARPTARATCRPSRAARCSRPTTLEPRRLARPGGPALGRLHREHRRRAASCTPTSAATARTASPGRRVPGGQPRVPMSFDYADESDPGPYPFPPDAPIEAGGDRHVLVAGPRRLPALRDLRLALRRDPGWRCGSGAVFDLRSNALRPDGWTSADAAGLPILPGLVRRDEVQAGEIRHALRFTVRRTQRAYVAPGHALREQRHRPRPAADGPARAPEGVLRHLALPRRRARDPDRAEALRDVPGRQRVRLVHQRRDQHRLGRRRPRASSRRSRAAPSRRSQSGPSSAEALEPPPHLGGRPSERAAEVAR